MAQNNIRPYGGQKYTEQETSDFIDEIKNRTDSAQNGYDSIDDLATKVKDVETDIGTNETDIAVNASDIATNASEISSLDVRVSQNETDIQGAVSGFQGELIIADTPTNIGYYIPTEEGTYNTAGGLTYEPTTTDSGFLVQFIYDGSSWSKNRVDLGIPISQSIERSNYTSVPSEDAVYNYVEPIRSKFTIVEELPIDNTIGSSYVIENGDVLPSSGGAFDILVYDVSTINEIKINATDNIGSALSYAFYNDPNISPATLVKKGFEINDTNYPVITKVPDTAQVVALTKYYQATISLDSLSISQETITEMVESAVNPIKIPVKNIEDKLSKIDNLDNSSIIQDKYILSNGSLGSQNSYDIYSYDLNNTSYEKIHVILESNVGSAKSYAIYDSTTIFDNSTLLEVGDEFVDFDKIVDIPSNAKTLLISKYNASPEPIVQGIDYNDDNIYDVIQDVIQAYSSDNTNVLDQGLSVLKTKTDGSLNILHKIDNEKSIYIEFQKCMFNELYTFYRISYVNNSDINTSDYSFEIKTVINTTTGDNIGPLNIQGGAWTGGNHSWDNDGVTKTAKTDIVQIFADNIELANVDNTIFCSEVVVKVVNTIYDPRVTPSGGSTILSEPLTKELVVYSIIKGDINVSLSQSFIEDATVSVYYGMQTTTTLDEFLTSGGNEDSFVSRPNAGAFIKTNYPKFNRWLQKSTNGDTYESLLLNVDYDLGDHTKMTGNISEASSSKLYHVLMRGHSASQGDVYSWNGIYSWKLPVQQNNDLIVFIYNSIGYDVISINLFSSYSGYIEIPDYVLKPIQIIDKSNGITVDSTIVDPIGVKITASNAGFINFKI